VVSKAPYDDGGFSGATMERPALQQLLVDIRAGSIDIIDVGGYNISASELFDFDLWWRLAEKGHRFFKLHETLVYKRIHAGRTFESKKRFTYSWRVF
jgi:hypothetical protein